MRSTQSLDRMLQFLTVILIRLPICLLSWSHISFSTLSCQLMLQGIFYLPVILQLYSISCLWIYLWLFHIFLASQLAMIFLLLENIQCLDQKYLVYSTKLAYSLVFLHNLYHYHLHMQLVLCYLLLHLIGEEIKAHK